MLLKRGSDEFAFYFNAPPETVKRAKALRKNMTFGEKIFWNSVRNKKFHGLKFRRQHPIEYYIADFYCPSKKLVIEIDGKYHEKHEQKLRDDNREAEINKYDLSILRFKNEEVINNLSEVLRKISTEVNPPLLRDGEEGRG